ncbi:hypothetical protein CYMTET_16197 [Cymbomonas tetramitiformis]|uniref:Uncharacterized protein n=1 Tax=Cymbomonas tetramitiformis TaxID=36881 RepID=A0AAE0L865_9CHLO|nr:hypothetical protein CYMTET_16197 [Cymbomonas tetramitiformis]
MVACPMHKGGHNYGHSDSDDPNGRDNRGDRKKTAVGTTSSRELTELSDNDATDGSTDVDDEEPFDIKSATAVTDRNREEMKKKEMHVVYYQKRFTYGCPPISHKSPLISTQQASELAGPSATSDSLDDIISAMVKKRNLQDCRDEDNDADDEDDDEPSAATGIAGASNWCRTRTRASVTSPPGGTLRISPWYNQWMLNERHRRVSEQLATTREIIQEARDTIQAESDWRNDLRRKLGASRASDDEYRGIPYMGRRLQTQDEEVTLPEGLDDTPPDLEDYPDDGKGEGDDANNVNDTDHTMCTMMSSRQEISIISQC